MFKQKIVLEIKTSQDRTYRFECDPESPLGEIHDVMYTMKDCIAKKIMEHHKNDESAMPIKKEAECSEPQCLEPQCLEPQCLEPQCLEQQCSEPIQEVKNEESCGA